VPVLSETFAAGVINFIPISPVLEHNPSSCTSVLVLSETIAAVL
jgi:hypothetical protein